MSKWGAHLRSAVRRQGRTRGGPSIAPSGTSVKARLPFAIPWKWIGQVVVLAGSYLALAPFGNVSAVTEGNAAAVWPAAGLAIAGPWWGGYWLERARCPWAFG